MAAAGTVPVSGAVTPECRHRRGLKQLKRSSRSSGAGGQPSRVGMALLSRPASAGGWQSSALPGLSACLCLCIHVALSLNLSSRVFIGVCAHRSLFLQGHRSGWIRGPLHSSVTSSVHICRDSISQQRHSLTSWGLTLQQPFLGGTHQPCDRGPQVSQLLFVICSVPGPVRHSGATYRDAHGGVGPQGTSSPVGRDKRVRYRCHRMS